MDPARRSPRGNQRQGLVLSWPGGGTTRGGEGKGEAEATAPQQCRGHWKSPRGHRGKSGGPEVREEPTTGERPQHPGARRNVHSGSRWVDWASVSYLMAVTQGPPSS